MTVVADKVVYLASPSNPDYVQIGTVNGVVNVVAKHARVTHLLVEALSHTGPVTS